MTPQKILILIFSLLFIGLLSSCSLKKKPLHPIAYYTLDYETPASGLPPEIPIALSLEKFKTIPPYHTNRIIYSKNKYSQDKYYYHQWITPPDEMITPMLVRDFIASNHFKAVMYESSSLTSYLLQGTIDEFYEQDNDDQWNAVLSITITLTNKNEKEETKRFIFQKTYKNVHPMRQNNPKGLAQALSMAMSDISRMIISDIYNELKQLL